MFTVAYMLHLVIFISCLLLMSSCERRVEVKKVNVGDVELAYYTRGNGDPLVMIMGFRATIAAWDPALLETLEKKYKLILFDNRGVGLSTDSKQDNTTIQQMSEDTIKLIKALGYRKVHLLGWSMGSRIAQVLALNHPEMVDTLILCSPSPGGKYAAKRKNDAYAKLTGPVLSEEEGLALIFPETPAGEAAGRALVKRIKEAVIAGSVPDDMNISNQTVERQVKALHLWDEDNNLYETLPSIKTPTLVTGGINDVLDSPENVRVVAERIPFAWSAYFPKAGHDFASQDHENFAQLVSIFIETFKQKK